MTAPTPDVGLPHPEAALVDGRTGTVLGGAHLSAAVSVIAERYAALPPGPILALTPTHAVGVLTWLAALQSHRPIALLDPATAPEALDELVRRYRPAAIAGVTHRGEPTPPPGYAATHWPIGGEVWVGPGCPTHPDLALLLPTSGRTGSPRLVRLSRAAVLGDAATVADALDVDAGEVTITSVPLFHSYGLNVLNSHLARGATVVLDDRPPTDPGFWDTVDRERVTSLPGLPHQYEALHRAGFDPAAHPALRTLTQSGGRLRPELVTELHDRMAGRFVVMYGHGEAGRMAILPPAQLPAKADAVGTAVRGGSFTVDDTAEVIFEGPHVMQGYATGAHDLIRGDDLGGVLRTGDTGRLDADGTLYLTGRTGRFSEALGARISLDDVERMLRHRGDVAAVAGDDRVVVWIEQSPAEVRADILAELAGRTGLHTAGFDVRDVPELPLLPTGKVDYGQLREMTG